jgi:menaquinol-cytochrome c reductase iron-sulfur subunit
MPHAADREHMATNLREAGAAIDAALADFPKDVNSKLDPAERALTRLRDALIVRLRAGQKVVATLEKTNVCLSLVMGMEYPQGGAKKPPLEQARALTHTLAAEIAQLPDAGPPDLAPNTEPIQPPLPMEGVSLSVGVRDRIHNAAEAEKTVSRRTALNVLIGVGTTAAAATVGVPVLATGLSPAFESVGENWQPVGPLDAFPLNEVTAAQVPVPRDDWAKALRTKAVYVWRATPDDPVVYSRNCTDASCPVVFDRGSDCFLCPCHGGIFLKDGTPIHGPPPRPLDRYTTRIRAGMLEIDLNSLPLMT